MSAENRPGKFTLEEVIRLAREETLKHGSHVPMIIAQGSQKTVVGGLPDLPGTHRERVRTMYAAGALLANSRQLLTLDEVFFVSEGWMSTPEPDGTIKQPPSQDPKRIEVLIVSGLEVKEEQAALVMFEMVRDDTGQLVELKELQLIDNHEGEVASPLLAAFVDGFRTGMRGKLN